MPPQSTPCLVNSHILESSTSHRLLRVQVSRFSSVSIFDDSQTVRRDFSMLVQIMVDTVLKKMLIERDVENAKAYTRTKISELLQVREA